VAEAALYGRVRLLIQEHRLALRLISQLRIHVKEVNALAHKLESLLHVATKSANVRYAEAEFLERLNSPQPRLLPHQQLRSLVLRVQSQGQTLLNLGKPILINFELLEKLLALLLVVEHPLAAEELRLNVKLRVAVMRLSEEQRLLLQRKRAARLQLEERLLLVAAEV